MYEISNLLLSFNHNSLEQFCWIDNGIFSQWIIRGFVTFVVDVVLVLSNFLYDIFVFHLLGFECLNVRPKNGKNEKILKKVIF